MSKKAPDTRSWIITKQQTKKKHNNAQQDLKRNIEGLR